MGKFSLAKFFAFLPQGQNPSNVHKHWTRCEGFVVAECLFFWCVTNHYRLVVTQVKHAAKFTVVVTCKTLQMEVKSCQAAVRLSPCGTVLFPAVEKNIHVTLSCQFIFIYLFIFFYFPEMVLMNHQMEKPSKTTLNIRKAQQCVHQKKKKKKVYRQL